MMFIKKYSYIIDQTVVGSNMLTMALNDLSVTRWCVVLLINMSNKKTCPVVGNVMSTS